MFQPIYHVNVSPTDGNGPTQGQRKTLTRVGFEGVKYLISPSNRLARVYHLKLGTLMGLRLVQTFSESMLLLVPFTYFPR